MNIILELLFLSVVVLLSKSLTVTEVVESKEKELETESRLKVAMEKLLQDTSKLKEIPEIEELSPEKKARMEEVREVMEWMDSQGFLSDDTQIQKLITRINETTVYETEILWNDLDLLQDFLRQIDNGENFGKMKGFELLLGLIDISVLSTELPDSYDRVAAMAAINFNAAIQNNPKAIEFALKADGLERLTRSLRSGLGSKSGLVAKRVVSAISSLIRDTPEAQKTFLFEIDGSRLLMNTLRNFRDDHSVTHKVLITVTDLVTSDHAASVVAFKDPLWLDAISDMLESDNLDLVEQALRFFTVFPLNHRNTPKRLRSDVEKLRESFMNDLKGESDEDLEHFDQALVDLTQNILDKLEKSEQEQNGTKHTAL